MVGGQGSRGSRSTAPVGLLVAAQGQPQLGIRLRGSCRLATATGVLGFQREQGEKKKGEARLPQDSARLQGGEWVQLRRIRVVAIFGRPCHRL
eukprot:6822842-Prymnesium_polylepis.1